MMRGTLAFFALLLVSVSHAADEMERWQLPVGAKYRNTMPLIGIMTQPCNTCPGEKGHILSMREGSGLMCVAFPRSREVLHRCWIREVDRSCGCKGSTCPVSYVPVRPSCTCNTMQHCMVLHPSEHDYGAWMLHHSMACSMCCSR